MQIDPSLKGGADPTAAAASAESTTAEGVSIAALYPALDVSKHVVVEYIQREKMPQEGAEDTDPVPPKVDTSPQAIYKNAAVAPAAVLTPPKDAETLAATMAASAGPDIIASMGRDGFLEAAKKWMAAKAVAAEVPTPATVDQVANATTVPVSDNTTTPGRHLLWETDFTRIDILVTFTPQAAAAMSGGAWALVNRLRLVVAETNKAYLDSRIAIGMNLLDARQVSRV